jgi:hypothetical protein
MARLTAGDKITSVSAIVLFVSMFFDWFVVSIPESLGVSFFIEGEGQSAWAALDYLPIVLVVTVVAALVVAAMHMINIGAGRLASGDALVATSGAVSFVLILFRIIDPPTAGTLQGAFGNSATVELSVEFGIFVAMLAAAGIAIGGVMAMKAHQRQPFPCSKP